jgi:hypothetical protein
MIISLSIWQENFLFSCGSDGMVSGYLRLWQYGKGSLRCGSIRAQVLTKWPQRDCLLMTMEMNAKSTIFPDENNRPESDAQDGIIF